ncbi:MAG: NCS2 family permease [Lachnospiraceae bacterium]|nr:NCS2 family permease [Lachnospiraceae bacterium]
MEKLFKLKEKGTDVRTELIAGLTTFMAMAYILAVNPSILSASGMDAGSVFSATGVASAIACFLMGLIGNFPFALSAGMGLNAYFTYSVVMGLGVSWQVALAAVFIEGVIFLLLSVVNVREAMFEAIPLSLKSAVSAGIGLFITIIALINAKVLQASQSTVVSLISFHSAFDKEYNVMDLQVCSAVLCLIGIVITAYLVHKKVKGNILLGILITWVLGIIAQVFGIYRPNPEAGFYSVIPSKVFALPASMAPTFGAFVKGFGEIKSISLINFIVVVVSFLFVDIFDTLGTLIGCAKAGGMLNEKGRLHNVKYALFADAVGTTVGAVCGTSTVTTFVESASGIEAGGRTGLTAITVGALFLVAMFFWPIFSVIPSFATAPALVIVGYLMMKHVVDIPWDDATESVPAFLAILAMPFFYSISEGIAFGIISYVVINLVSGNGKKITPTLFVIAVLFILKYILI